MDPFFKQVNFPYDTVRKGQDKFIKAVYQTISTKKNLLVSAPTGLGKTVSGLAPAIYQAKQRGLTVVCLTSRQTQANQVIKTIADIQKASGEKISHMAFIGKRSMCVHPERDLYPPQDFNDFCKKVRLTGKCGFYKNAKNSDYEQVRKNVIEISNKEVLSVEGFVELAGSQIPQGSKCGFCPYELAGEKAFQADVIICDYNYMFQTGIRENFLGKIGRDLSECILVVDEAHNLPDRIRNAHSYALNTQMLNAAKQELKDFIKESKYDNYILNLINTIEFLFHKNKEQKKDEYLITKDEFTNHYLKEFGNKEGLGDIVAKLEEIEALVKEQRVVSFVGRVANFLLRWLELDEVGYLRTIETSQKQNKEVINLKITCIDPSDLAGSILNKSFSSILMSGTLSPIKMYQDILGVANAYSLTLDSPFAKESQLNLIFPDVTSKYSQRTSDMYEKIATYISGSLNSANISNAIVFFPSYDFMEKILEKINVFGLNRKILKEKRFMTKDDKEKIVDEFKSKTFSSKSKVLFAVTSGSFAEGLDLPNKALEMVIVVGLPLGVPDLYTQALIRHFENKFKKGQMYGYIYPAMSKIIQAAGRCIRTDDDKGVIVFLDNRFFWPLYAQAFPKHWHLQKADSNYKLTINNFFDE